MDTELLAQARDLLAQASVIAEASCSRLDSHKSKYKPDSAIPRANGMSTHDYFALRIRGCRSDRALRDAVSALQSELEAIRKRPASPKVKTKDEVLYGCWSEQHYTGVARASGLSERTIRRWRVEAGFEPNYGRKLAA